MRILVVLLLCLFAACGDGESGSAPKIVIVGPSTGSVLFTPSATLAFRVEQAPAAAYDVAIGGESEHVAKPIAIGEIVELPLALAAGVNTIELTATGEDDATDRETIVLVVDAEVPLVELAVPASTHLAAAEVTGRIVSTHPVTSAIVKVGGGAAVPLVLAQTATGYSFTGNAGLALGANAVVVEATDERAHVGTATVEIERLLDDSAPGTTLAFPRDGQAVRTRQVLVRGTVTDLSSVASVVVEANAQTVSATVTAGEYTATLALVPGMNDVTVRAKDGFGNERVVASHIYYGQRLASGGGHGGAIRNGRIFTWGRNNLGQTGLDYVSHESRTAYCDRTLASARDIALCKATTITAIDAVCLNPAFVTPAPGDSPEAAACRAATRTRRDAICDAAGANAPANCKTSNTANLATACDTAYGAGTPASGACEASLACDGAYAAGSVERASCVAVAGVVPSVFPSPATPYAPVAIDAFVSTGTTQTFAQLGVTFTSLAFNQNASMAIDSAGRVWSWGDGGNGGLCLGDLLDRDQPHRVAEFGAAGTTAIAVSRGYDHVLVLRSDGTVWGCGLGSVGQVGASTSALVPTQIAGLPANIVQVLASSASSYALTSTGEVYAWGRNQYGNLGNGTASTSTAAAPTPVLVPSLANVVMIAAGRDHVLAARRDGTVVAWGLNASNQVDASTTNVLSPVAIAGITDARGVYANGNQGFFENAAGQLYGWGQNGSGNLGIPDDDDQPAPSSPVFGLTGVTDVAIGALQGFAMKGDQAFGWGWSFHGSLGAGTSAIHTWPYRTPLLVAFP